MLRFSNFEAHMLTVAIQHICFKSLVTYDAHRKEFALSSTAYSDFGAWSPVERSTFWLTFAHGVETLLKCACLSRQTFVPSTRSVPFNLRNTSDSDIAHVLDFVSSPSVDFEDSTTILNMHTMGHSRNSLSNLSADVLSPEDVRLLQERLDCFCFVRRNLNAHVCNPIQTLEIAGDMTRVYIPMLNTLVALA
jgi:hypothetical protein